MTAVRGALLAAIFAINVGVGHAAEAPGFRPIDVTTRPIETFGLTSATRFGDLEFRGGIILNSPDVAFGSLSGIDFSNDGRTLYAIADTGHWFAATPVEENGRLVGLTDARIAPVLNSAGEPLAGKHYGDAEGLRIVEREGREAAIVSFERVNDVRLFVANPTIADAHSKGVKLPSTMKGIDQNRGLEAVAVAPADGRLKGAIVAIAERSLDKAGNNRAWIVNGAKPGAFSVVRSDSYDVTDAAFLPNGDLLILERKLSLVGLNMRIRRIAANDIKPGAVVDGPVVMESDMRNQIDNMEGLAVRVNDAGETIIALISDDNHNPIQRTLILTFALVGQPTGAADAQNPKT